MKDIEYIYYKYHNGYDSKSLYRLNILNSKLFYLDTYHLPNIVWRHSEEPNISTLKRPSPLGVFRKVEQVLEWSFIPEDEVVIKYCMMEELTSD